MHRETGPLAYAGSLSNSKCQRFSKHKKGDKLHAQHYTIGTQEQIHHKLRMSFCLTNKNFMQLAWQESCLPTHVDRNIYPKPSTFKVIPRSQVFRAGILFGLKTRPDLKT